MKFFLISLCSVLITILLIGGFFFFTQKERISTLKKDFVANINGEIISLEDFRERLGLIIKIIKIPYNSKQFDKSKFKEIILQNLIEEKLLLAEVNRLGIGIILMIKPNLSLKSSRLIISPLILATKSFFSVDILSFWGKEKKPSYKKDCD